MCGIAGIINLKSTVNHDILSQMSASIQHRGPDDQGQLIMNLPDFSAGLASRRLSIIDLTAAGHMPMCNQDQTIWIVYNGEIYNHLEIRQKLISRGVTAFRSRTDTETLLYAYQEYGLEAFKMIDGIFACAVIDVIQKRLVLARDRMGVKPLYYFWNNQELIFSSELKSLLRHPAPSRRINQQALQLYLCFGYVPSPNTLIDGIHKLTPGHTLTLHNRQVDIQPFWQPVLSVHHDGKDPQDEVQRVRLEVEQAVKAQLMSDVPVGSLLSGGLDSTIISALAQKNLPTPLHTFSVGFITHQSAMEKIYNKDLAFCAASRPGVRHNSS